jgi:hypothetical protein
MTIKQKNRNFRDAKNIIHKLHNFLKWINARTLKTMARGYAKQYEIPQKIMLQAMSRYIRLHHEGKK